MSDMIETKTKGVQEFNARETVSILHGAMKGIVGKELSANNINAACNCAARITDILKVHLEFEKLKQKTKALP